MRALPTYVFGVDFEHYFFWAADLKFREGAGHGSLIPYTEREHVRSLGRLAHSRPKLPSDVSISRVAMYVVEEYCSDYKS